MLTSARQCAEPTTQPYRIKVKITFEGHGIDGEERAGCFASWFVFLVSCDCCVVLPHGAMGLSAVCDCGIS